MKRFPPLSPAQILERLSIDSRTGNCTWVNATKHHPGLDGEAAGSPRTSRSGKKYWIIKINSIPYKRAYLVFTVVNGKWPDNIIDHIDGDSLNDKPENLRDATTLQNAWNHKTRSKKSPLPMGVRYQFGKFHARIACEKKQIYLGAFSTAEEASSAYVEKRKELFGEYSGL